MSQEFLPLCDVLFNIISLAAYFCDVVFDAVTVYSLYEQRRFVPRKQYRIQYKRLIFG